MIQLLVRWWPTWLFRHFGWPKILPFNYTFLISTQCNSRCKTCNIWRQKHDELSLPQWDKVISSLGRSPFYVTVSGGEPFLQPHLVDFCRLIIERCHPSILVIPTNSILWPVIDKKVGEILSFCKQTKLVINLSLDGVGDDHDHIRGVKGNFTAFKKNYSRLKKIQKNYPQLTIGIHSVISKFNIDKAESLFSYALSLKPDQYITEAAEERVELDTVGTGITPAAVEYERVSTG